MPHTLLQASSKFVIFSTLAIFIIYLFTYLSLYLNNMRVVQKKSNHKLLNFLYYMTGYFPDNSCKLTRADSYLFFFSVYHRDRYTRMFGWLMNIISTGSSWLNNNFSKLISWYKTHFLSLARGWSWHCPISLWAHRGLLYSVPHMCIQRQIKPDWKEKDRANVYTEAACIPNTFLPPPSTMSEAQRPFCSWSPGNSCFLKINSLSCSNQVQWIMTVGSVLCNQESLKQQAPNRRKIWAAPAIMILKVSGLQNETWALENKSRFSM